LLVVDDAGGGFIDSERSIALVVLHPLLVFL
jgi:hypothetical protein